MTALRLVDAAGAVPPEAARAAGYAGVMRYVSQEPGKNLTPEEAAGYLAAELTVNAIYEDGTGDYQGGETTGNQHGLVAKALLDAIGFPADRALIVAVDTDIQPGDYPLGLAYVATTAAAAGRLPGVYGPDGFVRYCMAQGVRYGMNAAGWSDGASNAAQIQQGFPEVFVGGVACDPDLASAEDYGQWPYSSTPPGPAKPPPAPYVAATPVAGQPGHAWFLRPDGEVDGLDVARARIATYGGLDGTKLNKPPIAIASTPSGRGYWLAAQDGGVFNFGDATFHGSAADVHLQQPVVGIVPVSAGAGYVLVAADGGVFTYGEAHFDGSLGHEQLNAPVVGAAATPSGQGYWLVAGDGGVFAFGDARFEGSAAKAGQAARAVGIAACGAGYVVARGDGSVVAFGTPQRGDYPGLPAADRLGVRRFVAVSGAGDGTYTLLGSDGSQYHFAERPLG